MKPPSGADEIPEAKKDFSNRMIDAERASAVGVRAHGRKDVDMPGPTPKPVEGGEQKAKTTAVAHMRHGK